VLAAEEVDLLIEEPRWHSPAKLSPSPFRVEQSSLHFQAPRTVIRIKNLPLPQSSRSPLLHHLTPWAGGPTLPNIQARSQVHLNLHLLESRTTKGDLGGPTHPDPETLAGGLPSQEPLDLKQTRRILGKGGNLETKLSQAWTEPQTSVPITEVHPNLPIMKRKVRQGLSLRRSPFHPCNNLRTWNEEPGLSRWKLGRLLHDRFMPLRPPPSLRDRVWYRGREGKMAIVVWREKGGLGILEQGQNRF
jgi:hypothetical protein